MCDHEDGRSSAGDVLCEMCVKIHGFHMMGGDTFTSRITFTSVYRWLLHKTFSGRMQKHCTENSFLLKNVLCCLPSAVCIEDLRLAVYICASMHTSTSANCQFELRWLPPHIWKEKTTCKLLQCAQYNNLMSQLLSEVHDCHTTEGSMNTIHLTAKRLSVCPFVNKKINTASHKDCFIYYWKYTFQFSISNCCPYKDIMSIVV